MKYPEIRFAVQVGVWVTGLMVICAPGVADHAAKKPAPAPKPVTTKPVDLTPAKQFRTGLAYEEAVTRLGGAGEELRHMKVEKATYRWSDERGSSFICRFEDGKLIQKTAFRTGLREITGKKPLLNKADHEALKPGTPLQQALRIKPAPGRVSASRVNVVIYRWKDKEGHTFEGRFEDGKLRQNRGREMAARAKATLAKWKKNAKKFARPAEVPNVVAETEGGAPEAVEAGGDVEARPSSPPLTEDREAPSPVLEADASSGKEPLPEEVAEEPPVPEVADAEEYQAESEPAPGPRVHVVGASRRQRGADRSSDRVRLARLPEFRHSLRRGSYEIRVRNPTRVQVELGLRAQGKGRNATVEPGGATSFFVDQGVYSLYFIYRDDPHTLLQGSAIAVGGVRLPDADVVLDGGAGYTVTVLEETSAHRR